MVGKHLIKSVRAYKSPLLQRSTLKSSTGVKLRIGMYTSKVINQHSMETWVAEHAFSTVV